jgi:hypothetical protein
MCTTSRCITFPAPMIRVRAGISYALTEAMDEGHCGFADG